MARRLLRPKTAFSAGFLPATATLPIILLLSLACVEPKDTDYVSRIVYIWRSLGWSANNVIYDDAAGRADCAALVRAASESDMSVSCLPYSAAEAVAASKEHSVGVTVMGGRGDTSGLRVLEMVVTPQRPSYTTLFVDGSARSDSFVSYFEFFAKSRGFFRMAFEGEEDAPVLYRVQTFRDQRIVALNEWRINGTQVEKVYDLQGAAVTAYTRTWQPWLKMENCTEEGKRCASSGILADMMDILGAQFNFTWYVDEALDGWGTVALTGDINDPEATWGGAMGSAFNDEYDTPLSVWLTNFDRAQWCDFTTSFFPRQYGVIINKKIPAADFTLFLRPFVPVCWFLSILVVVVISACVLVPPRVVHGLRETWLSYRLIVISSWLFFILINAYYGGALTMFFSSAPSLPFESVRQGLAKYPDWKMIIVLGEEELVKQLALAGDRHFAEFWSRAKGDTTGEIIVPDYKAALERLTEEGYFLYYAEYLLAVETFLELRHPDLVPHFLPKEGITTASLIFPKHSPLTEVFDTGIQILIQTGHMEVIIRKWTTAMPTAAGGSDIGEAQVLEGRQVTLVFLAFAAMALLILSVWFAEVVYKQCTKMFTM